MAKGIIPGATEDRAAFSIVVLIAHKTVGILEVCAPTAVQVLGPFFSNSQMSLGSQAANEALWILCKGDTQRNGNAVNETEWMMLHLKPRGAQSGGMDLNPRLGVDKDIFQVLRTCT